MATADYTHEQQELVLWNNAQLITPTDLNNAQKLREKRVLDHALWHYLIEGGQHANEVGAIQARPVGASFAVAPVSPAGMAVTVKRGCLLWSFGPEYAGGPARSSSDSAVVAHATDADRQITIDAAHATLTRIDLLSYKVEYDALDTASVHAEARVSKTAAGNLVKQVYDTRRRTLLTITYTPGTPGSGVPPSPPANQISLATVTVAALATTITQGNISDFRTPAGATKISVPRSLMKAVGTWTEGVDGWTVSGASQELRIPVSVPGRGLSSIAAVGSLISGGVGVWAGGAGGFANLRLARAAAAVQIDTSPTGTLTLWRGNHSFSASVQVLDLVSTLVIVDNSPAVYTNPIDVALWSNGRTSPVPTTGTAGGSEDFLFARQISGAATDQMRGISFTFYGV